MTTDNTSLQKQPNQTGLSGILSQDSVKSRFAEILGKKAPSFISSIISATKATPSLMKCEPDSIISSAVIAATLDLPIQGSLGFAYIVPYKRFGKPVAQFQIGYKGLVQLAMRTGQFKTLNVCEVYEGELIREDRFTGEYVFDMSKRVSQTIIGYVAYFKLLTGFEKYLYWTIEECKAHGKKFSKSFDSEDGLWKKDFDSMAMKTVLKMLLSKYAPMSVDMQQAVIYDQAVIVDGEAMEPEYTDNPSTDVTETKEGMVISEKKQQESQRLAEEAMKAMKKGKKITDAEVIPETEQPETVAEEIPEPVNTEQAEEEAPKPPSVRREEARTVAEVKLLRQKLEDLGYVKFADTIHPILVENGIDDQFADGKDFLDFVRDEIIKQLPDRKTEG